MAFLIIVLTIGLIWLWTEVAATRRSVSHVEELLATAKDEIRNLSSRLLRIEQRGEPAWAAGAAAPAARTAPAPASSGPAISQEPIITPAAARPAPPAVPRPVPPPDVSPAMVPVVAASSIDAAAVPLGFSAPPSVSAPLPPAEPVTPPLPPSPPETADSWEMVVGTSWLNKIGVLVFVVGVALLVRYSFGHIGAAGRVAMGYAISLGMLAGGVWLERQQTYRNYAYGLVAGGWAGTYFTTFAMHGVPSARLIDSDLAAVSLLMMVATGMIAHSLRYRSQVVTGLAFVVAYVTLSLSPLTGFALTASVPLAVSLLFVSQRYGWSGVSAMGIVATYGAFVVRHGVFPGGLMDANSTMAYATLASYWLTFEIADIIGLRAHAGAGESKSAPAPVLALNAIGFMGSLIILLPGNDPILVSRWLFGSASAYVASAALRAWLLPYWRVRHSHRERFDSTHAAMAIASVLFAIAIGLRFRGNRVTIGRLLEAQLLITTGLMLGDVWLRRMGSLAMVLAALQAWVIGTALGTGQHWFTWGPGTTSAVTLLVMAACYGSREAIHRRGEAADWFEDGYSWMALALAATVIRGELTPAFQGLAGLIFAAVLLEVGFRRTIDYVYQAFTAGALAAIAVLAAFLASPQTSLMPWGPLPTERDVWIVLPAATLIAAFVVWRLRSAGAAAIKSAPLAAGVAATMAAAFLATFEWRALAPNAIAPTWALTGVALLVVANWRHVPMLRWQAVMFSAGAVVRAALPLMVTAPQPGAETWSVLTVIASIYLSSWLARRTTERAEPVFVLQALTASASFLLALLEWRTVATVQLGPALAATGGVLLGVGLWRAIVDVRWHGYGLLIYGAALASSVFGAPEPSSEAWMWLGGVIALLYICGLVTGRVLGSRPKDDSLESLMPGTFLLGATGLLAGEISREVRPSLVTLALGAQGLGSMVVGLAARERLLRLSGFALLMACILKLFVYDLRELEALARIFSFVVLGLILLGISWTYTRYREQIRKFL